MLHQTARLAVLAATATVLVACGQSEPDFVAPETTTIFTKDGSAITQPVVVEGDTDTDDFED